MKKKWKRGSKQPPQPATIAWEPFQRCDYWMINGEIVEIPPSIQVWKNNIYTVNMEEGVARAPYGRITWLSIKRNDREVIHDWRELQRIKNEICGTDREAVEIYPREDRLVDTSNQFHLWVMPLGFVFPFGYADRLVIDETVTDQTLAANAKQRAWPDGQRPADAITGQEFDAKWKQDGNTGLQTMLHRRVTDGDAK